MQTDPNALRYMVSRRSATGGNLVTEMRVFDCESDARDHILAGQSQLEAETRTTPGWIHDNPDYFWKLYEISPIKNSRRIVVSKKYLGFK